MQVLTSLSGLPFSAASAGFAPTNSADVSAIASAYQVVSSTGTQLHAGTAYLTGVNGAPISASRAGQAANASLANSAYYDGTGRLISALPDSAAVSAIASSYAESAASGKQDTIEFGYDANNLISSIDGSGLAGQGGGGGGSVDSPYGTIIVTDGTAIEGTNSAIGTITTEPSVTGSAANDGPSEYWPGTYYSMYWQTVETYGIGAIFRDNIVPPVTFSANTNVGPIVQTASSTVHSAYVKLSSSPVTVYEVKLMLTADAHNAVVLSGSYPVLFMGPEGSATGVKELAWKDELPVFGSGLNKVSSINGMSIAAETAVSAGYASSAVAASAANSASTDSLGRPLSELAWASSVPSGVASPSGTIVANGFSIEATNSAVTTALAPGYATTAVSWGTQVRPDTPLVCTLPSANEHSKVFVRLDWGSLTSIVSAVYDGNTAIATAAAEPVDIVFDVPNATTVNLYGSTFRSIVGSASASAADAIVPDEIGELAWASALPTYEYDGDGKISAIDGSALAGGGGGGATGDYVEKSATSVAIGPSSDTYQYSLAAGGKVSAWQQSLAVGSANVASTNSLAVGTKNSADYEAVAVGSYASAYHYSEAFGFYALAENNSFAHHATAKYGSVAFGNGTGVSAYDNSVAIGSGVTSKFTAMAFGTNNKSGDGSGASGAAFVIGDGTSTGARHDLMVVTKDGEITMFSGTADTVGTGIMSSIRAISAAATGGGGGVDSATVSAIASAYVESGVSSKLDSSASSDFYSTGNPSGFVDSAYVESSVSGKMDSSASSSFYTTANESGFVGSAYVDSAVSGKLDTTAFNSGDFYSTGNPSGFVGSAYVESSVSGKQDASAMSSYALSSDVSGTVDLVSSQSANWGGSALQLSAGPGVTLTKSGNLLVAGLDETVLWSSNVTNGETSATLSGSIFDFESFRIFYRAGERYGAWLSTEVMNRDLSGNSLQLTDWFINASDYMIVAAGLYTVSNDGLTLSGTHLKHMWFDPSNFGYAGQGTAGVHIYKVVGINRTAEA